MTSPTQVWHLRPNRDAAATKLENVFVFARQFLDGSLERIFTVPGSRDDGEKDSEDWKVDVDMCFGCIGLLGREYMMFVTFAFGFRSGFLLSNVLRTS